jgi:predicted alpha/beta-fold hydrolase
MRIRAQSARRVETDSTTIPAFEPHPWLKDGHRQTIVGKYVRGRRGVLRSTLHHLAMSDGDSLCVLESVPRVWRAGDPVAVLVHGLCGCAESPFVVRLAVRLVEAGTRVVRMNLRGAGAGFGLAKGTYHSGRTEDVRAAISWLAGRTPGSPIALVGFSLGANLALKLAAEAVAEPVDGLDCVVAANPPLDLAVCCRHLQRGFNRLYDRHFLRLLKRDVSRLHAVFPELGPAAVSTARSLFEFDDLYTAPRNRFEGALDYYTRASAGPLVPGIRLPGLVIHARDDPFIPPEPFEQVAFPPQLTLELLAHGGHLGYVSRNVWRGDRRWLEARIACWLEERWSTNGYHSAAAPAHHEANGAIKAPPSAPGALREGDPTRRR